MDREEASNSFRRLHASFAHMRRVAGADVASVRYQERGRSWAHRRLVLRLEDLLHSLKDAGGAE